MRRKQRSGFVGAGLADSVPENLTFIGKTRPYLHEHFPKIGRYLIHDHKALVNSGVIVDQTFLQIKFYCWVEARFYASVRLIREMPLA